MTQASAGVGNTPNTAAGMRGKAGPGRKGSRLDAPVRVVDLGVVAAAEYADPVEVGDQVSAAPARSGPMQQKERLEGGGRASDGDPDDSARSSAVVEAVDLTQSPPPPFQPIIIEDTPTRQERGEERELVDLTASTPRPSVGEMRRVTTIDRDLELARRLQEEEEQALRATSQSSSSSSAGPEAIDEDLLLARRLQEEEDAEIARRLLQSARERTSPPAVSAEYIHGILRAQQRERGDGSDEGDDGSDGDDDGWRADELEAMQRLPLGRHHAHALPRGRYQPRMMARGRGRAGQHLPRDPQLRELMMREIDPNDYETLLQLDEQKKNKHAERQAELLIRNLPRYAWPDKTVPLTGKGKGKRRTPDEKPGNGKRRRRSRAEQRPQSPSRDEERTVAVEGTASSSSSSSTSTTPESGGARAPEPETCPICLEQFSDGQVVCVTPCASLHTFHETCIKHWLRVKAECPIDKTQLT